MTTIVLVTTGGTIAMAHSPQAGGAMPSLVGDDFAKSLPPGLAAVHTEEHCNLPSAHFTLDTLWSLCQRVRRLVGMPTVDGVVITHGTDVLEETAFLLDIVVDSDKPIVLTGAMRTASDPGYEGMGNLVAALRVASNPEARGYGVLVVMNDEIHAARDVTKIHTTALNAFASPPWGPIGHVDRDRVILARRPPREHIPAPFLEPDVHLITLTIGCDDRFLRWLLDSPSGPPRGVVIEALGGGRVPPWWLSAIGTAVQHGVAVVITSRTGAGRTIDGYAYAGAHRDLADLGCLFANGLSGPKARLKLMAALATAATPSDLASYFPF